MECCRRVTKERREDTPTKSESSDKEEEVGEITLPPMFPLCITPPPFSDITGWQVGITVSER
jgi:hypothetical protein